MKLKIGHLTVNVKDQRDSDSLKSFGFYSDTDQAIYIDKNLNVDRLRSTLLHEVMHVIFQEAGLSKVSSCKDVEEEIITALANGVIQVIDNNKRFADLILCADEKS